MGGLVGYAFVGLVSSTVLLAVAAGGSGLLIIAVTVSARRTEWGTFERSAAAFLAGFMLVTGFFCFLLYYMGRVMYECGLWCVLSWRDIQIDRGGQ